MFLENEKYEKSEEYFEKTANPEDGYLKLAEKSKNKKANHEC